MPLANDFVRSIKVLNKVGKACLHTHITPPLRWRHNDHAGVSNHQPHGCLLNRLFRRKSKKTSKLRVTGLCAGNSPGTGEFPAQMASYAENVSIWWRHHVNTDLGYPVPPYSEVWGKIPSSGGRFAPTIFFVFSIQANTQILASTSEINFKCQMITNCDISNIKPSNRLTLWP